MEETQIKSSLESLEVWVPEELKDKYWRAMAHLRSIPPDDEIFKLMEVMGIVGSIMKQIPGEIAAERVKFREEFAVISNELKDLINQATAKGVQVTESLGKISSSVAVVVNTCDKSSRTMADSLQKIAERVDVKSIGDRLTKQIQDYSIKPITTMNEKLEVTRSSLFNLVHVTENLVDVLCKARWWVPWVAAFSISGAIFTFTWYSYQTSVDQSQYEGSARNRRHSR